MLNLAQVIKPWKEADALSAHINLYGFWNETTFLTKSGDLGIVLRVAGVDYESLDNDEQQYAVKRLESALKAFGEGFHIYQYLFKTNRPEIPFASYDDALIDAAIDQRREFFESKRDRLYEIELFYVIVLEGARSKTGIMPALLRMPRDPQGGIRELKAQFTSDNMKVLLRTQIDADLVKLEQRVQNFTRQLADLMPISVEGQQEQFGFFRRLLNFDAWRIEGRPQSTQYLDFQVVNSNIEAERDHLRVGEHFVRILTMKEAIAETRPLVLDRLLKIESNFYVVTEWTPLSMAKARKEVDKRRRHFNMSKSGFVSQMGSDPAKTNQRDVLIDESKQADIENLGECLRVLGDGQMLGDFSLTVVLYSTNLQTIQQEIGEFAGVFTNADGALFTETYNQLNAFFATVPGNYAQNLRKMYLLNSNYADLSFLFTIHPGEKTNAHLRSEYLAVLETDNATPYYLNLHNGEVAHTLILGMTGSGKSFLCNFLLTNAQKYRPQTYIFDIGGSFQSLTEIFGGTYLNVGQESRDFTINPFSLPDTKENLQFLFSFFRVLIEGNDKRYKLDFKEERKLWEAIERMYVVAPEQRTVSTFSEIIGELKERLHRWTKEGQYGFLFDNVEDTLSFSKFQTFNFAGWGDAPEVLEPLLFYVLHRASNEIADPAKLATFKTFLLDEAWLFIKNETIRNYVVQAQKTWRKHNAAMILATQSIKELEDSGMLAIVAESCPTKIFLANPEMNRQVYRDAFHLNDTEIDIIADLIPPDEMLIRKPQSSKKVRLNVDSVSYWIATNNARDNLLKREAFAQYGIAEGVRQLATTHPFQPRHQPTLEEKQMQKLKAIAIALMLAALPNVVSHAQTASRNVSYHSQDIVPIRAKVKYTTLIVVPAAEKIMEAATGDKDFWIVDVVGNFCFVHPAKAGISSNLNLITDKGNIYSFTLTDITASGGDPDLKVIIQPADASNIVAANGPAQYVPATQLEQAHQQMSTLQSHVGAAVDEYKSAYPLALKFDYSFKTNESPFDIQSIYHDDKFTYIKTTAPEKFSVYEMRDGKPNLINYELREGTYIIPKVMDNGYVELGKKKMEFTRKG